MTPFDQQQIADLIDIFGSDFLAYVLNLEGTVTAERILAGLLPNQAGALQILAQLRVPYRPEVGTPEGAVWDSRINVDRYIPEGQSSLANLLRIESGGTVPSPRTDTDPVIDGLYKMLTDAYPAFLLPKEPSGPGPSISAVTFNHPARTALEAAVLADPMLSKLFSQESEISGRSGFVYRTNQASSLQLRTFARQQIAIAHAWASLESRLPTVDEVADKLVLSVATVRRAIAKKPVTVPMRVGLTGVLLPDGMDRFDFGWATIRRATEADQIIAERTGVAGKLQATQPDGTVLTIDYAGDVVLVVDVPYKVLLSVTKINPANGWPQELRTIQAPVAQDVESLRLALALALEDDLPALIVPSWQVTIDPLAIAALPGWNDTRRTPNLVPRQLTKEQVDTWAMWAQRVRSHRTPSTAIAVRRMLQALGERYSPEDVLVDAVVVWENLFGTPQETTMRVCTAMAWLLGKDAADRLERQRAYKSLYGLRSNIVHGSPKVVAEKIQEASRETVQISLSALRELFEHRPDLLAEKTSEERGNKLLLDIRG